MARAIQGSNRRERRKKLNENNKEQNNRTSSFQLINIKPKTKNQEKALESFFNEKHLMLLGCPGTGKSFLGIYLALNEVFNNKNYEKLVLVRSAQPSKSVGFLPGILKEKTKVLEEPFADIVNELFGRGDSYEYLKGRAKIDFISTSYIRGLTFHDTIIVVDECQNLEWNELFAIMTRLGDNSRIIFCGDYSQSDLENNHGSTRKEDILKFIKVISKIKSFDIINFTSDDIVRSGIVKQFLIACEELNYV